MEILKGFTTKINSLDKSCVDYLFLLISKYFDGMEKDNFIGDLYEKDYIIILYTADSEAVSNTYENLESIKGFSTVKVIKSTYMNVDYGVVFSGDTIIDKAYWGTPVLPKAWTNLAFALKNIYTDLIWYWLLISSGYRTYRYLPIFFIDYYPRYDKETPSDMKDLMDYFATARYHDDYNKETGVIIFSHSNERVKEGISEVTERQLKKKVIKFFVEKNPGYSIGHELVCFTRIDESNFNPSRLSWTHEDFDYLQKVILDESSD